MSIAWNYSRWVIPILIVTMLSGNLSAESYVGIDIGETGSSPRPNFSPGGGDYSAPVKVSLSCRDSVAIIRYTLDGTTPTEKNGVIYSEPIVIDRATLLTASAFSPGLAPSPITDGIYLFKTSAKRVMLNIGNSLTGNAVGRFAVNLKAGGFLAEFKCQLMGGGITRTIWNAAMLEIADPNDKEKWNSLYVNTPCITHTMGGDHHYSYEEVKQAHESWEKLWPEITTLDDVTLQPRGGSAAEDSEYSLRWLKFVREKFPDVQPWLYVEWTEMGRQRETDKGAVPSYQMKTLFPAMTWEESMSAMMLYGEEVQHELLKIDQAKNKVRILPVALAFGWIRNQIEHGKFPDAGTNEYFPLIHSDIVHATPEGCYLIDAVWFAAMYGQSPEGKVWPWRTKLTPAQVQSMQRLAWDVVKNYPDCGLYEEGKTPVGKPELTPSSPAPDGNTPLTLSSSTPGAWFRYTLDGTEPARTRGYLYCGVITVRPGMTVKAVAYKSGMADSAVTCATYPPDAVSADNKPPAYADRPSRELVADKRWLYFPILNSEAPLPETLTRTVKVSCEGKLVRIFTAELADKNPGWWSPLDISEWKGRKLVVQVDKLPERSLALDALHQNDELEYAKGLYQEPLRPQFHYSARRGWLNDDNGLYYNGEYHLFYGVSPFCLKGSGIKSMGHAVSKDLVHWEELGIALHADEMGEIYSGSAVIDWENTSGLGEPGKPPFVLAYTRMDRKKGLFTQCLAYSLDNGRTFTKYLGNPVLPNIVHGNRDPKIFWHEPTHRWVMVLHCALPGESGNWTGLYHFLSSKDLKKWTLENCTSQFQECPDLFSLPVDGDANHRKWVVMAANGSYKIGMFDGRNFNVENHTAGGSDILGSRVNANYYAGVTFNGIPEKDGRRIQMNWFRVPMPGMPFNQAISVPLELTLRTTPRGIRIHSWPVRELDLLRTGSPVMLKDQPLRDREDPLAKVDGGLLLDLQLEIDSLKSAGFELTVQGIAIRYDAQRKLLSCPGMEQASTSVESPDGHLNLRVLADVGTLEIFVQKGLTVIPLALPAARPNPAQLGLRTLGGEARIVTLQSHRLGSIW